MFGAAAWCSNRADSATRTATGRTRCPGRTTRPSTDRPIPAMNGCRRRACCIAGTASTVRGRGSGKGRCIGRTVPERWPATWRRGLGEESGGPVGHIIPVPSDGGDGGDDDPLSQLKADLANARGRTVLTETTAAGWGEGKMAAARKPTTSRQRFGAMVPDSSRVAAHGGRHEAVLSACAVPVSLVSDADGTSQRESVAAVRDGQRRAPAPPSSVRKSRRSSKPASASIYRHCGRIRPRRPRVELQGDGDVRHGDRARGGALRAGGDGGMRRRDAEP